MNPLRTALPAFALVLLPLLVQSCAAPAELVRRSEASLEAGRPRKAYEWAKKALRKDPENAGARAALSTAASAIVGDWKARIENLATVDTVMAADQVLDLAAFRREVAQWGGALERDPAFSAREGALRAAAAESFYRDAERELEAGNPKSAHWMFRTAQRYIPAYRDAAERASEAYELALARVVVLPFVNHTGVHGLSETLNRTMQEELGSDWSIRQFQFTELVAPTVVLHLVSLAQVREMPRPEAAALGRRLGADQVIRGRVYGERTHTSTDVFRETIFHRVVEEDAEGNEVERYVEESFEAVLREREVKVNWFAEALDTESGHPLADRADVATASAYTVYTTFTAEGDCDDYCLLPPGVKKSDPELWKRKEKRWKQAFGSWELADFLEHARKHRRSRAAYRPAHRGEFHAVTRQKPFFLNDLPGEDDLVRVALRDVWKPVHAMLLELDRN